jgi:hypothetical protein
MEPLHVKTASTICRYLAADSRPPASDDRDAAPKVKGEAIGSPEYFHLSLQ